MQDFIILQLNEVPSHIDSALYIHRIFQGLLNRQFQFNQRGSSLPWNRIDSHAPGSTRVPSMVSAASGISGGQPISRQSSREALDAAAEFLRMRNSPLDDLTEQFSRLASSRPRSVGRS